MSIWDHADGKTGRDSHPGLDLLIEETTYRRTEVSRAASSLKARGWIHETYRGNGRAKKASVFDLVPDAPNPAYRCPEDRAADCSTCSKGCVYTQPLAVNSCAETQPLADQGECIVSAVQGPSDRTSKVVCSRTPIDPKIRSDSGPEGPPPDPFASSGNESRNGDLLLSGPILGPSGSMEDKGAEPPDDRPGSEGLSKREAEPKSEDDGHVTRWPSDKPLPDWGDAGWDPFTTYVDEVTGEPLSTA